MEHPWISQVPATSLHTCHGLRTPLTRHNLAIHGCFTWTSTALQASSARTIYYRSDSSISGTRIPYGLYNSLSTLHIGCSSDCVLTQESISNLRLLATRKTRYEWLAKPYSTGTYTLLDVPSFACRTNVVVTSAKVTSLLRKFVPEVHSQNQALSGASLFTTLLENT